jgi:hypothetical protein
MSFFSQQVQLTESDTPGTGCLLPLWLFIIDIDIDIDISRCAENWQLRSKFLPYFHD